MLKNTYLLLLLFLVFSCQSSKDIAQKELDEKINKFFVAIEKQDFETAKVLVTPATQKILDVVIADSKKYKEFNDKPQTVKIEIVERTIAETTAYYKIRIFVGEKSREEVISCIYDKEIWYFDIPEDRISIFRYVVFYDTYDTILILYKKKYVVRQREVIEVVYSKKKHTKKRTKKHTKRRKS